VGRTVAPRNDQNLARPVLLLLLIPPQRSSLRREHIIAAAVDPIGAVEDSDLAEPPSEDYGAQLGELIAASSSRGR
jgi:hypothetical protein